MLPMVAVMLTVLVASAAFTVDLGMQRVVRSDMQTVADVVALDLARDLRGRTAAEIQADPDWSAAVADSLGRNSDVLGTAPTLDVELVMVDQATGAVSPASGTQEPDGVRVTAHGSVSYAFRPGDGAAQRSAVAAVQPQACFRLGSYALGLDTADSVLLDALLGQALGGGASVTGISYTGLAGVDVSLADLAVALDAGTADELADTTVGLGELALAAADVLRAGAGNAAAVSILEAINAGVSGLTVRVGDLVSLAPGADSALETSIDALDLVSSAILVANGTNAIAVPSLGVNALGLAGVDGTLTVVEAPRQGCGPAGQATASTAQVRLDVTGGLGAPGSELTLGASTLQAILEAGGVTAVVAPLLASVGTVDAGVDGDVALALEVAGSTGTLTDLQCGRAGAAALGDAITVDVVNGLATIGIDLDVAADLSADLSSLGPLDRLLVQPVLDLLPPLAEGTVHVELAANPTSSTAVGAFDALPDYESPVATGGDVSSSFLVTSTSVDLDVLGLPAGAAADPLVAALLSEVVTPAVDTLVSTTVEPLLDALGVTLNGSDVWGVPRPDCGATALRG
ncbi:hypothetical protein [Nocardioides bruguierae]|uniref:hypothetical protein n=1 Tax=Nocardioides bruguierae TaxID=2945102 RepID=UPI0020203D73|nr:hypothetical protein [Nocardioides bruguierae]MCL8026623.1 hypothetical protein [Nocardioides bruguierae]